MENETTRFLSCPGVVDWGCDWAEWKVSTDCAEPLCSSGGRCKVGIEMGLGSGGRSSSLLTSDPVPVPLPPSGRTLVLPRSRVSCRHSIRSLNGSLLATESRLRLLLSSLCSRSGDWETRVVRLTAVVLFPRRFAAASRSGQAVLLTNLVSRMTSSSSSVGDMGWKEGLAVSAPWPLDTLWTVG
jgi:hypothetical protein